MIDSDEIIKSTSKPDLTPMIDVVFLLLVFFMVTTTLIKQEAELSIELPSEVAGKATDELPIRHYIDILADGSILLNGSSTGDTIDGDSLPRLAFSLDRIRRTAERSGQEKVFITIQADPFSPHYASIAVLNACAEAKMRFVSFAGLGD